MCLCVRTQTYTARAHNAGLTQRHGRRYEISPPKCYRIGLIFVLHITSTDTYSCRV